MVRRSSERQMRAYRVIAPGPANGGSPDDYAAVRIALQV